MSLPVHIPEVQTDGGPWAFHDQACAVCSERHAILQLHNGHYQPCGTCSSNGWRLSRKPRGHIAGWLWERLRER